MDILMYLDISPPDMFAGFCGSVVYAIASKKTRPGSLLGATVAGSLVANWFGAVAGVYIPGAAAHVGAFVMGFGGIGLLRALLQKAGLDIFAEPDASASKTMEPADDKRI